MPKLFSGFLLAGAVSGGLFSQADATGIGAIGGWASFGVAGVVIGFLLVKHLPAERAASVKQIADLLVFHDLQLKEARKGYQEMLDRYDKAIKVVEELTLALKKSVENTASIVDKLLKERGQSESPSRR